MADYAHAYTDEQIKDLERQIHAVYAEASRDMQAKLDEFNAKFEVKDRAHREDVASGRWTQEQYDNWRRGQIFQTQQWEAKRDDLVNTMHNANVVAAQMINGRAPDVFGVNASYMNYSLEHAAGVNFGFGIYDASTVARLIRDNPQMLPEWKIDEKKDYIWNEKKVNNAVTQGIIQGESLSQISRRISQDLVMQNEDLSRTFAQTAMTGAQNAGRQESLEHATSMGIEVYKQWMATLDSHTRSSHADVDGESVPVDSKFSNGLQYPAEAGGPPAEVYNCRCTMVGDLKKYPEKFKRYNNEKGKPIQYMSYRDWEKAKNYGKAGYKASVDAKEAAQAAQEAEYEKYGGKEAYDILSKYKDYDDFIENSTTAEYLSVKNASVVDDQIHEFYTNHQPQPAEAPKPADTPTGGRVPVGEQPKYATVDEYIEACKNNPDVDGMLRIEDQQFSSFTPEEIRALKGYTGNDYTSFNGYLRDIGRGISPEDAADAWSIDRRDLDNINRCHDALASVELDRDMVFRRGTDWGDIAGLFMQGDFRENTWALEDKTVEELNEMFIGAVGTYHGFTSTSSQWSRGFSGGVEVLVDAPKGTHAASIMRISQYGTGEGETLFMDGTRVICNGFVESDGHKGSRIRMLLSVIVD